MKEQDVVLATFVGSIPSFMGSPRLPPVFYNLQRHRNAALTKDYLSLPLSPRVVRPFRWVGPPKTCQKASRRKPAIGWPYGQEHAETIHRGDCENAKTLYQITPGLRNASVGLRLNLLSDYALQNALSAPTFETLEFDSKTRRMQFKNGCPK